MALSLLRLWCRGREGESCQSCGSWNPVERGGGRGVRVTPQHRKRVRERERGAQGAPRSGSPRSRGRGAPGASREGSRRPRGGGGRPRRGPTEGRKTPRRAPFPESQSIQIQSLARKMKKVEFSPLRSGARWVHNADPLPHGRQGVPARGAAIRQGSPGAAARGGRSHTLFGNRSHCTIRK